MDDESELKFCEFLFCGLLFGNVENLTCYMESKPRSLKRHRVKKPKTFKRKLKSFIKNQFGVNWKIIILTPLLMGVIIFTILLWVINLLDHTNINTNTNTNMTNITIVEPK